jgi:precorrin-2 dehydrogenase
VSAYPIVLEGATISALIVGGGRVAARKARALIEAGARVHVVSPAIHADLEALEATTDRLRISRTRYAAEQLDAVTLVIAATDDPAVNARVADDARMAGRLVNVADAPDQGSFVTPAVHRCGDIVVSVTTGGVPNAAGRIRDAIGRTIDARYASAVHDLGALRRTLIAAGDRDRWGKAAAALIGDDFCERVESGDFAARISEWR